MMFRARYVDPVTKQSMVSETYTEERDVFAAARYVQMQHPDVPVKIQEATTPTPMHEAPHWLPYGSLPRTGRPGPRS